MEGVPTSGALAALMRETGALSAVLHDLEPEDLGRATNCPPWALHELVVHIGASIRLGDEPFASAEPHEEPHSASDYYRRPDRDTPSYRQDNVERTVELTRVVLAEATAVRWFDEIAARTIDALSEQDLDQIVVIPGRGAMRLGEWVVTRVVAVAAHAMDVAISLSRPPWTTPPALKVVRPVLVALLGSEPPDALGWDDQTLLMTGTGRRALTGQERHLLGPRAERFPLLS